MERNSPLSIGLAIIVSALGWLATTVWSEYAKRPVLSYERTTAGSALSLHLKNESFLTETGTISISLECRSETSNGIRPQCMKPLAQGNNAFGVIASLPYNFIDRGVLRNTGKVATVEVNLAPRSQISIISYSADGEAFDPESVQLIYSPQSRTSANAPGHILLIERGGISYILGNFPKILATATVLAFSALALVLLLPILSIISKAMQRFLAVRPSIHGKSKQWGK